MPPSMRSDADRVAAVALGRLDEVGAAVGHPFEHGPDDLGPTRAPREADERAAGAEVPHRGAQAEQRRDEPDVARGRRSRAATASDSSAVARMPEVVAQPLDTGAGREHDRLGAPGGLAADPEGDDGEGARAPACGLRRPRPVPGALVEHPAGAEGCLGQAGQRAALAHE